MNITRNARDNNAVIVKFCQILWKLEIARVKAKDKNDMLAVAAIFNQLRDYWLNEYWTERRREELYIGSIQGHIPTWPNEGK
jgi:hypothetical protein